MLYNKCPRSSAQSWRRCCGCKQGLCIPLQRFSMFATGFSNECSRGCFSLHRSNYTTLMWLMLCNICARDFDRRMSSDGSLLIISVKPKDVRRFLPDVKSLYLLTNLLSTLWPTACKVSLCTGPPPPCMWPSTLVALCEWMELKQILSMERLGYLAKNTSRHLIRAIQAECFHQEPPVCFGRHMVLRLLGRGIGRVPHCRGILIDQRRKMLWSRLHRKLLKSTKNMAEQGARIEKRTCKKEHAYGMQ